MGTGEIAAVGVGAVEMAALRFGGPVGGCQRLLEGLWYVALWRTWVGCGRVGGVPVARQV